MLSSRASAQTDAPRPTQADAATPSLTAAQLTTLAAITHVPAHAIGARVDADPGLRTKALTALSAYEQRRKSGKEQAAAGFAVLGIGDVAATLIMVTTPGYPDVQGHEGRFVGGMLLGVATTAIGLAVGIPGILKYARRTPAEVDFSNELQYPVAPAQRPSPTPPVTMSGPPATLFSLAAFDF